MQYRGSNSPPYSAAKLTSIAIAIVVLELQLQRAHKGGTGTDIEVFGATAAALSCKKKCSFSCRLYVHWNARRTLLPIYVKIFHLESLECEY